MSLLQFFYILRARRAIAGIILLATFALALTWIIMRPTHYTARAPVLVDVRNDPVVGGTALAGMIAPSYMSTQIDIVRSDRVAERVVQMLPANQEPLLRWSKTAQAKPNPKAWLAHVIQQGLDVKPARESNIVNISWTGRNPTEAARVANAFATAYVETHLELKTDPAKKYADWFEEQVRDSRQRLEKAQEKLSAYQQQAGIVSSDERNDYEVSRLNELSQQLLALQSRGSGGGSSSSADNAVTNTLRHDLARMESKIGEAGATMGAAHPQMQRMQAEASAMRSRLSQESSRAGAAADNSVAAVRARQRELEKALAEQKSRVLGNHKQRGELSVLQREVENAQKTYETVSASAAQSRLQSLSNQTNVMRLASAVEPLDAAGPSASQAMLVAAVVGTLLAVAGALLLELLNRRVRSVEDLASVTHLPILASVPAAAAAFAPLRLTRTARLALASRGSPA